MELTISLLFFAIAAAVCLQLFAKSHTLNKESDAANGAHTIATSIADTYLSGRLDTSSECIYYSENLSPVTDGSNGYYRVELDYNDGTLTIDVKTTSDDVSSYTLSVYKYIPKEVAS